VSSHPTAQILMINAQVFVDEWWRKPARDTFFRAAASAALQCCGSGDETIGARHAFFRMAEAIRVGDGHVFKNAGPLATIVAQMLNTAEAGSAEPTSISQS
jgi:hypothetical protein